MSDALRRLCGRLLREVDDALLDRALDAFDAETFDVETCELFRHSFEAGVAGSLREVGREPAFLRWVEETCSAREQAVLCSALGRVLGTREQVGCDDPARLGVIDPLPNEARALSAWAARYRIASELERRAAEVLGDASLSPETTLMECVLSAGELPTAQASLLAGHDAARAAERYLTSLARRNAARTVREALWRRRPEGALRPLLERLVAVVGEATLVELHALSFAPLCPVSLDARSGACRGQLKSPLEAPPIEARVQLSGFEQRPLHTHCTACGEQRCLHVAALAGRLIDACLLPEDRLHEGLLRFVARPTWQLFFEEAEGSARDMKQSERTRLSFVLRVAGERVSVGVRRERARADRSHGPGRLVAPSPLLAREHVSDDDRGVLELLAAKSRTLSPGYLPADAALLRALASHPRVSLEGSDTPLLVIEETLEVRANQQPDGLSLQVLLDGEALSPGAREKGVDYVLRVEPLGAGLRFALLTPSLRRLLEALASYRGVLPKESFAALASYLAGLEKVARVLRPSSLLGFEVAPPRRFLLRIVPLPDEGVELSLWMRPFALSGLWPPGLGPELVHGLVDGAQTHARRDLSWEKQAAGAVLSELQLEDALRVAPFRYRVESTQEALALLTRAARVADRVELEWAENARKLAIQGRISQGDLKVELFKRGAFFFPEGQAQTAELRVAFLELLQAAQRNERFVRVGDGNFAEIESTLFDKLREAQLCVMDVPQSPKLSQAASAFWLARLGDVSAGSDAESRALLAAAARRDEPVTLHLPARLDSQLRDYQREGVRFLISLTRWAPGACLLDEMGLGKTVQSIAFLLLRRDEGPALVVCPTSLVDNWCSELARFAPELRALVYRGKERRQELEKLTQGAVLVISYELLLRDRTHFEGITFASQIVDEAQVVKNARTLKARALRSLDVTFRVVLTGTPVENRLADLWSLFHLIAPGLLGSWPRFRARFAVPIERYDDRERADALKALVSPLMLRRQKDQVLRELPARTEVVQLVALSASERALYDAALGEAKRAIGKHKRDDPQRRVHILAALTRLRQLACHPRLVLEDALATSSSKLSALLNLLDDLLPRGQRVLVFSQFVAHLALVREALTARGISQLWLDGATPGSERAGIVARFQAGEADVFLISLKAGGTGLTLTAADYVVHMDPWWNPSTQDQASDRAHRMGQTRPVTIVKLVTENTIEERVLALHEHKRRLAATIIGPSSSKSEGTLNDYEALLAEPNRAGPRASKTSR